MRQLIRRLARVLWEMPGDFIPSKGRHRGRPALVARKAEHRGATLDWSPTAELARVDSREPEETEAEAAEREAQEIADYWADLEAQFAADVHASFEAGWAALEPIHERLTNATRSVVVWSRGLTPDEADEYLARFVSGTELTGEYPIVREAVAA